MTEYLIAARAVSTVGGRSFHQLRQFQYVINSDKGFGTNRQRS
jgi:hypothetical protein